MPINKKLTGTITRDDYNNMVDFLGGQNALTSLFDSDLTMNNASKGLIVLTPDGTKKYRIRVNNSGALVTEQV